VTPAAGALRILHVSETHGGGVEAHVHHFATEQVRAGHAVHVLAPPKLRRVPGVDHSTWSADRRRPWTAPAAMAMLRRAVREHRPDVVHLHSFGAGFLGRLPGAEKVLGIRVPVVYQPHAWSFDIFGRRSLSTVLRAWEGWAARRTDLLLAICDDEIREGRAAGVDCPTRTLGVAVDVDRFRPVEPGEREKVKARLGLTHTHVLLCLGRLTRQKGQDLLLPAWEAAPPQDAALVLLGPGGTAPLRELAPTQWGRTVLAVGEHSDVRPWLWASDVLVLPSRYESIGLAVAEAMACGVSVVATAVNGVRETVLEGPHAAAGCIVPVGDMQALLTQARLRLADPVLRLAEGRAGRDRAEAVFPPAGVAARLESAYREAISIHAQRGNPPSRSGP
jgi:glycosyltransferase involved in cell wall biosynthesis